MRLSAPSCAITLIAAAGLLTGCSSDQEDGSTLKADPDLPFASFQRPADGSTLQYRGEVMAPDWELQGTVALQGACVGLDYTNDSGDQEFVTLGLPMPVTWDAGTQTVSGTGYEFVVGDALDLSGQLIEDDRRCRPPARVRLTGSSSATTSGSARPDDRRLLLEWDRRGNTAAPVTEDHLHIKHERATGSGHA